MDRRVVDWMRTIHMRDTHINNIRVLRLIAQPMCTTSIVGIVII